LEIKRILRYLKGTKKIGLWYPKRKYLTLVSYIDADWAGCINDRRSTSGATFYFGECVISCLRNKQSLVSLSMTEEEYIKENHVVHRSYG
jgi:hypothetical protein